jgi:AcrR family transcriptional regulator
MAPPSRSRRAEHAADTRAALVDAARPLFAARGYAGTGTEDVVAAARVTRGALYHHFRDKADLFRAVMEQVARELAERLIGEQLQQQLSETGGSPLAEVRLGFAEFLDACIGSDFQRIVLVDGPGVLGQDVWEELAERYGLLLLTDWLERAIAAGEVDPVPPAALARLLVAVLTEASLMIGRAEDPQAARADVGVTIDRLMAGLMPRGDGT